jgi:hypothetical protein
MPQLQHGNNAPIPPAPVKTKKRKKQPKMVCPIDGQKFRGAAALASHMRSAHTETPVSATPGIPKTIGRPPGKGTHAIGQTARETLVEWWKRETANALALVESLNIAATLLTKWGTPTPAFGAQAQPKTMAARA